MMNKTEAATLHKGLDAAINAFLTANGYSPMNSRLTYALEGGAIKVKFEAAPVGAKAMTEKRADATFSLYMKMYNLREDFVSVAGLTAKLVGYRPKARKAPWIAEDTTGKKWALSSFTVMAGFKKAA